MSMVVGINLGRNGRDSWNNEQLRIDTEHTVTYKVVMTTGSGLTGSLWEGATEYDVAQVSGVPVIGSLSAIVAGAYCIDRQFNEVGPAVWEVECQFSNVSQKASEAQTSNEPWDLEPTWRWSFENMEVPMNYDVQDPTIPVTNSAGERIVGATTVATIPVLTIRRFELAFSGDTILDYTNHVNSTTFWGAGADKVLCAGIAAEQEKRDNVKYWSVEYVFKFFMFEDGWTLKLLDEGTYYWVGGVGTGKRVPFGDDAFNQIVGNLDGAGGKNLTSTPAFVGPYNRYKSKDFNTLTLGPWTWA